MPYNNGMIKRLQVSSHFQGIIQSLSHCADPMAQHRIKKMNLRFKDSNDISSSDSMLRGRDSLVVEEAGVRFLVGTHVGSLPWGSVVLGPSNNVLSPGEVTTAD